VWALVAGKVFKLQGLLIIALAVSTLPFLKFSLLPQLLYALHLALLKITDYHGLYIVCVRGRERIAVQWMVCIAYGGVLL
jgi:hypothetical protein